MIAGGSAGGGLAAGTALMASDRRFPILTHQAHEPDAGRPSHHCVQSGVGRGRYVGPQRQPLRVDRTPGRPAWRPGVSMYTAPAREPTCLAWRGPTWDCGSAQTFRDETIDYAHGFLRQEFPSTCTSGVAVSMDSTSCPATRQLRRPSATHETCATNGMVNQAADFAADRL